MRPCRAKYVEFLYFRLPWIKTCTIISNSRHVLDVSKIQVYCILFNALSNRIRFQIYVNFFQPYTLTLNNAFTKCFFKFFFIYSPVQYYLFIYIERCHNLRARGLLETFTSFLIKTLGLHYILIYLFAYGQFNVLREKED